MNSEDTPENSLPLAYEFVTHSYEWGQSRLDAVERRLQGLLVYLATITFVPPVAIVSIAKDSDLPNGFESRAGWAFVVFVVAATLLIAARALGSYRKSYLETMLEQDWGKAPGEFMQDALHRADLDLKETVKVVNRKSRFADGVSFIIVVQIVIWLWPWIERFVALV